MPTPVLAQAGQSSETDSSSIPELQESSRGEISADSGEETWTRQLAFQTARSVDSSLRAWRLIWESQFVTTRGFASGGLGRASRFQGFPTRRPRFALRRWSFTTQPPVFIRLRSVEEGNLLAEGAEGQQPIMSYFQKILERAYLDQ